MQPGSASLLALMNDPDHRVVLAMDRSVWDAEWFGCHPCRNTSSVRIATADVKEKLLPHFGRAPLLVDL